MTHTAKEGGRQVTPADRPLATATVTRRHLRTVRASVYAPCNGRSWWWLAYICPYCGAGHLGRARTEADVPGVRRSRCGHLVIVVAARTYRGRPAA